MSAFANASAFQDPRSRLQALGADLSGQRALVDAQGQVVAYARTGGMLSPARCELPLRQTLYRFGGGAAPARDVATGGWWLHRNEFEQLVRFANGHGIYLGLAMRMLCLVPPEWSDAGQLIRARVVRPLLAWRGLANTVVTPMTNAGALPAAGRAATGGMVRMPHQNEIASRRLHQLFIPGLRELSPDNPALSVEQAFRLDPRQAQQGFLYL